MRVLRLARIIAAVGFASVLVFGAATDRLAAFSPSCNGYAGPDEPPYGFVEWWGCGPFYKDEFQSESEVCSYMEDICDSDCWFHSYSGGDEFSCYVADWGDQWYLTYYSCQCHN